MQPLIKWPGGKRWALKHILPLIPPHETYCEVFAGGLAVLLAKPPSPIEIANDLNGELVALYRCIQFHPAELKRELSHHQTGRQNVLDYARQPGLTDIQKAARFLLLNRASFGAGHHSYAPPKTGGGANSPGVRPAK